MASAGTLLLVQEAMARATRVCIYDPMGMGLSGWAKTWRTKHVVLSNGSNQLCGFLDPICPQSPQPSPEVRKSWRAIWASNRMPGPCFRCWAASSGATASFQGQPAGSLWWEDRRKTANQGELINVQVKLGIGFHKYRGVRTLYDISTTRYMVVNCIPERHHERTQPWTPHGLQLQSGLWGTLPEPAGARIWWQLVWPDRRPFFFFEPPVAGVGHVLNWTSPMGRDIKNPPNRTFINPCF